MEQVIPTCKRNFTNEEIQRTFGKSDEDLRKCDRSNCPHLIYENGMMMCDLLRI